MQPEWCPAHEREKKVAQAREAEAHRRMNVYAVDGQQPFPQQTPYGSNGTPSAPDLSNPDTVKYPGTN